MRRLILLLALAPVTLPCRAAEDLLAWPAATSESRPWSYWWWLGSAVDRLNLTRELERYSRAGWGGVHIIPIYGAKGYESRYIEYLSPKWMEMLDHAVSEARRLGMGVDMTTGTGWCFGGPDITNELASAAVSAKTFDVSGGGRVAEDLGPDVFAIAAFSDRGERVDLTSRLTNGKLTWSPDSGRWRVYAVFRRAATRVKRAAPGGTGFMLNPFYAAAVDTYLGRFAAAFDGYRGAKPRAMYHDSFEYGANWSPDLLEQFAKRRGYRLENEFPALFGSDGDRSARVKSDYRETLADLELENLVERWARWCRARGIVTRNQAHGSPGNLLDLYAAVDVPETEMFNRDRSTLVSKFASSAAHVAGRKLVSAETGTWLKEHFNERLADVKDLVDQLFLAGVNHVVYHGTCYSPDDAPWPGWLFYASTQMNPRNAFWRDVPALNAYIARAQSLLQHGRPDNDLLVYWPVYDVWHNPNGLAINKTVHVRGWIEEQHFGALAQKLYDRGYSFDFVSDRQLEPARGEAGRVRTAGGEYSVLLVPKTGRMPVRTLERLVQLARSGATVVFEDGWPEDVPGLAGLEKRRAALAGVTAGINFSRAAEGVEETRPGSGRILKGEVETALRLARVRREPLADRRGLFYLRRASAGSAVYFLVNRGTEAVNGWVPLAGRGASAALLDPMSGRTGKAAVRTAASGVEVYLQMAPGESLFVRLSPQALPAGSRWPYRRSGTRTVPIIGEWQVQFVEGGPELPPAFRTGTLSSWTGAAGAAGAKFAGTARYSIRFDAPAGSAAWRLDLGDVRESARVRLNGRDLGTLIQAPFQVQAEGLKPGANLLEVEVTNLSANRLRDLDLRKVEWKVFHDINIVNLDYKPLIPSGWPVRESGLLGPVVLHESPELALP